MVAKKRARRGDYILEHSHWWALTEGKEERRYVRKFPENVPMLFDTRSGARAEKHNHYQGRPEIRVVKVTLYLLSCR